MATNDVDASKVRCGWVSKDPVYIKYHDEEWGKPERDSVKLFELLCLEGQQAGLSWITVLKKRDNYRKLFFNFDPVQIEKLTRDDVQKYLREPGIIKHKAKLEAIINNAKFYLQMKENGEDFSKYIWSHVNNKTIVNSWNKHQEIPTRTEISATLSKDLKSRGYKFVGPTICYAFMQAAGLVNDHITNCVVRTGNDKNIYWLS